MKIKLPKTPDPLLKAIFKTPKGDFNLEMMQGRGENWVEVDLPEDVDPVEVEVYAVGLGHDNKPVSDLMLVKPYERRNAVPAFAVEEPAPIKGVSISTDAEPEDEDVLEPSPDLELSDE